MVSFICNSCGNTVKKNQVEKHYQNECRSCTVLACIDCGTDFHGNDYNSHTSCITEAEKYQGKLFRPKDNANKGELKQQEWMKQVLEKSKGVLDPKLKNYLNKISEFSNVPRKKPKFLNFCRNSLRVYNESILEEIWNAFDVQKEGQAKSDKETSSNGNQEAENDTKNDSENEVAEAKEECATEDPKDTNCVKSKKHLKKKGKKDKETNGHKTGTLGNECENASKDKKSLKKKKRRNNADNDSSENDTKEGSEEPKNKRKKIEEENDEPSSEANQGKFNWQKTIKAVLKEAGDDGIAIKKLQKKVLSAYQSHGINHQASTIEEMLALFRKKLACYPKAKTLKERVTYKNK